jgi:hypothetical protein
LVYCPYTDRELGPSDTNREHIVPLALGGVDGIEIPVCKKFNSEAGSKLDGALANDFLVMTNRDKYGVTGHSGTHPVFIRNSSDPNTGKPLKVYFDQRDGLKLYSPADRQFLTEDGPSSVPIKINVDVDIALRFVAKVALAAGYFVYGDRFRNDVKHSELRAIMNHTLPLLGDEIHQMGALVDDRFSTENGKQLRVFRSICGAVKPYSLIGLVPDSKRLTKFVGILGDYMGMISVPTDTRKFPNENMLHWGHVIVFSKPEISRLSFRNAMEKMIGLT